MPNYEDLYCETRFGFKTPDPFGAVREGYRSPVWKAVQGDSLVMVITDSEHLLTEDACSLLFVLKVSQFEEDPLWSGTFDDGIEEDTDNHKVLVTIPKELLDTLSRGSYRYSLKRTDNDTEEETQVEEGQLLVDYDTASPYPEVPFNALP